MIEILCLCASIFFISGLFWFIVFYKKEKKLLNQLEKMLNEVEQGDYNRQDISEAQLSKFENKFKSYIDSSVLARNNQNKQKAIIQQLISDLAHQTLTPISNLKIYSGLLLEDYKANSEIPETIREQTDKLDFLIQSLVKLSRMETGIISLYPRNEQISVLFNSLEREYREKAREKNIDLYFDKTLLQAKFDFKWTKEAMGNILDNAIKYTDHGGLIQVHAKEYTFFIGVEVSDTGMGIAEGEISKIFTRFYRSFSVNEQPGVGIGLYLARKLIQAQKGYIKVNSEQGKGSVFSVFLPVIES